MFLAFNCTEEENTESITILRQRVWLALRTKIDEQTADAAILSKLRSHFEERFRYDEQGVPRVWKPEDDIDGAFTKAKDEVRYSQRVSVMTIAKTLEKDTRAHPPLCENRAAEIVIRLDSPLRNYRLALV